MGGINYSPAGSMAWRAENPADTVELGDRRVPRVLLVEFGAPPIDDEPMVFVRLEVIDGRPQVRELAFRATGEAGREIRQGDLDAFPLADVIERAFSSAAFLGFRSQEEWRAARPEVRRSVAAARRGVGTRKVNRAFLERIAEVYRAHVNSKPTQAVAEAFLISHSTAAEYVRRARREGLLPPTTSGKRKA